MIITKRCQLMMVTIEKQDFEGFIIMCQLQGFKPRVIGGDDTKAVIVLTLAEYDWIKAQPVVEIKDGSASESCTCIRCGSPSKKV